MSLSEWELWACAAQLIETRGKEAGEFAASRIEALKCAGDVGGALAWSLISGRVERLEKVQPESALVN